MYLTLLRYLPWLANVVPFLTAFYGKYRVYILGGLAGVLTLFVTYHLGHWKGVNDQKLVQATARTVAIEKGVQAHGKKQQEVNRLSDPDLDGRIDKWMRD